MRKADIYFKGDIIQTVECDGIHTELSKDASYLVIGKDLIPKKIAAIVPFDHMIIFREDLTFTINGSDLKEATIVPYDHSRRNL